MTSANESQPAPYGERKRSLLTYLPSDILRMDNPTPEKIWICALQSTSPAIPLRVAQKTWRRPNLMDAAAIEFAIRLALEILKKRRNPNTAITMYEIGKLLGKQSMCKLLEPFADKLRTQYNIADTLTDKRYAQFIRSADVLKARRQRLTRNALAQQFLQDEAGELSPVGAYTYLLRNPHLEQMLGVEPEKEEE